MASFAHAENGDAAYAEALGPEGAGGRTLPARWACTRWRTRSPSPGGHRDGAQWMRDQGATGLRKSRMRTHNAWHLAMFDAEEGNVESALGILDAGCFPPARNRRSMRATPPPCYGAS